MILTIYILDVKLSRASLIFFIRHKLDIEIAESLSMTETFLGVTLQCTSNIPAGLCHIHLREIHIASRKKKKSVEKTKIITIYTKGDYDKKYMEL